MQKLKLATLRHSNEPTCGGKSGENERKLAEPSQYIEEKRGTLSAFLFYYDLVQMCGRVYGMGLPALRRLLVLKY